MIYASKSIFNKDKTLLSGCIFALIFAELNDNTVEKKALWEVL